MGSWEVEESVFGKLKTLEGDQCSSGLVRAKEGIGDVDTFVSGGEVESCNRVDPAEFWRDFGSDGSQGPLGFRRGRGTGGFGLLAAELTSITRCGGGERIGDLATGVADPSEKTRVTRAPTQHTWRLMHPDRRS